MKTIKISDVIGGTFAVTTDDGSLIFDLVDKNIQKKIKSSLDFADIIILTTAFLNAAIGQLYSKYTSEEIAPYLKFVNVADDDKILFKKVIERAKEYFADQKGFEENSEDSIYGGD